MAKKIVGWFLLFLGVGIIVYSLYFSFSIFTGKSDVPQVFTVAPKGEPAESPQGPGGIGSPEMMQKLIGEQISSILPPDLFNKFFNLFAWSICAGILIYGGAQISGIGIKLLKEA